MLADRRCLTSRERLPFRTTGSAPPPPFWDLLIRQLLRPNSSNLPSPRFSAPCHVLPCLAMSLLDFSPRIPLGTFLILPFTYGRAPNAIPPGVKSRMCPPYPQRDRKRRLIGAVCRNRIKRVVPCRCLDGHVKEPYEMSMAWEPDRRSNVFFSPPAHLCAVTCMTEISLIVTLNI